MCSRVLRGVSWLSCRSDSDDAIRDLFENRQERKKTDACSVDNLSFERGRNAPESSMVNRSTSR